jgi:hypothetical protein
MVRGLDATFNEVHQGRLEAVNNFLNWQANAKKDDRYIYHRGYDLQDNIVSIQLKKLTMKYAEMGLILLFRKRDPLDNKKWQYIAVRAFRPSSNLVPMTDNQWLKHHGHRNHGERKMTNGDQNQSRVNGNNKTESRPTDANVVFSRLLADKREGDNRLGGVE